MHKLRALRLQAVLLVFLIFARVGVESLPQLRGNIVLSKCLVVATIAVLFWAAQRLLNALISTKPVVESLTPGMFALLRTILRAGVFILMLLVIVDSLGISITPILASLGVGSIAVALALQDTLGNLFSGLYILIDRPLALGDTVRLDNGIEGTVSQIGWRSTHLQLSSADTVVIPNSRLASAILTNYSLPRPETAVSVEACVGYESDLDRVEKVAKEVGDAVMKADYGGVPAYQSSVRFHAFAESSIQFTVTMHAKGFADKARLRHEYMKALKRRFDQEGIRFPYPQRVVHTPANAAH
jgi:small-conductance mechanosensitive channel